MAGAVYVIGDRGVRGRVLIGGHRSSRCGGWPLNDRRHLHIPPGGPLSH